MAPKLMSTVESQNPYVDNTKSMETHSSYGIWGVGLVEGPWAFGGRPQRVVLARGLVIQADLG